MKRIFYLLILLIVAINTYAYDFQYGNLYYNITSNEVPYTVEVSDAISSSITVTIPETVTYNGTTYSVTSIGDDAFFDCRSLTSITIPNSVTSIGDYAFAYCSSLTSITIGNSVTSIGEGAFCECRLLTSITIPNSVMSIGIEAFLDCYSLSSVTIGNGMTSIGEGAFSRCIFAKKNFINISSLNAEQNNYWGAKLVDLEIDGLLINNDTVIDCRPYIISITIPNSISSIGDEAFYGCKSLTSITIPNSVTSIGSRAFYCCESLTSITIPNSVTSIGNYAFDGCNSLAAPVYNAHCFAYMPTSFKGAYIIPDGIKQVVTGAFHYCTSLTSIIIPNSVTSIGDEAFRYCSSLATVTIGNSVTSIGDYTFSDCRFLSSVTIPNSVTSIGNYAFAGCNSLASISIGNSVTSIGYGAFSGCSSLPSISIPNSVTSIGFSAFSNCNALTKTNYIGDIACWFKIKFGDKQANPISCSHNLFINDKELTDLIIPNSVDSIFAYAFSGCSSFSSVTVGHNLKSIGRHAFDSCSSLTSITWNAINCHNFKKPSSSNIQLPFFSCNKLITSFTIGDSVQHIPSYLCYGLMEVDSITIPNSVTSIGEGAFQYCYSIKSITIPNSVTTIARNVFQNCVFAESNFINNSSLDAITNRYWGATIIDAKEVNGLFIRNDTIIESRRLIDSIIIPSNVKHIVDKVFLNKPLSSICVQVMVPPTLGTNVFDSIQTCYIPCGTTEKYVNSSWGDYVNKFEESVFLIQSGQCGDNLHWTYNDKTLSITGTGDMYDCCYWELLKDSIAIVEIANGVTNISEYVFADCKNLTKVSLPNSLEEIGANAFANCRRLYEIYSYASIPPLAEVSSFTNYNATLYVPCEHKQYYQSDMVFSLFNKVECISSEEVETDGVIVVPGANNVTITWLKEDGAETYSIVIKKDDEVICTLTFNSAGQLINIAFAPGRHGNHPAQYAEQASNGYRFTVTGLTEATQYAYNITTKDAANNTIATYSGEFTTMGGSTSAVEDILQNTTNVQKLLRNGQLIIVRDGVEYNAVGQEL